MAGEASATPHVIYADSCVATILTGVSVRYFDRCVCVSSSDSSCMVLSHAGLS